MRGSLELGELSARKLFSRLSGSFQIYFQIPSRDNSIKRGEKEMHLCREHAIQQICNIIFANSFSLFISIL